MKSSTLAFAAVLLAVTASCGDDTVSSSPQPGVVLSIAGIDPLIEDANHLLQLAGRGGLAPALEGFISQHNDFAGIDRSRSLGGMLFFDSENSDAEPRGVIFVPVTSPEDLQVTLQSFGLESDKVTAEGDLFTVGRGGDQLTVRLVEGYALAARSSDAALLDPMLLQVIEREGARPPVDARLCFLRAGFPEVLFERALAEARAETERDLRPRAGEQADTLAARTAIQRYLFSILEQGLTGIGQVTATVTFNDPSAPGLRADVDVVAEVGSDLANQLTDLKGHAVRSVEDLPLRLSIACGLSAESQQLLKQLSALARSHAVSQVEKELSPADAELVADAFGALEATIGRERIDLTMQFHQITPEHFAFVASSPVERAGAIDALLRRALALAEQSREIQSASLDIVSTGGLTLHQIRPARLRRRDARLYGGDASILVGVSGSAAWLAIGAAHTSELVRQVHESDAIEETPTGTLVLIEFHLRPWLRLAQVRDHRVVATAERVLGREAADDRVEIRLSSGDGALRLSTTIGAGLVEVAVQAVAGLIQPAPAP